MNNMDRYLVKAFTEIFYLWCDNTGSPVIIDRERMNKFYDYLVDDISMEGVLEALDIYDAGDLEVTMERGY